MTMIEEQQPTKRRDLSEIMAELGAGAEQLRNGGDWQAMLKTQAMFHRYSLNNQLLIWCQMPEATRVTGYRKWQAVGRQVRKGEKGLTILAPRINRREVEGVDIKVVTGFGHAKVFDISQTDGDDLPDVEWPAAGVCPPGLLGRLIEASCDGTHVSEVILTDADQHPVGRQGARGWYSQTGKSVHLVHAPEAQLCSTLLHELGHAHDPLLELDDDRGRRELVAESVCYVLGGPLGVDVEAEAFHYIASWKGDAASLVALAKRVGDTVKSIRNLWEANDNSLVND